jgi:hypothetical protein
MQLTFGFAAHSEGFEPPTARSVAWCSASIWSAPDGSGLLTLDASSIQTDPDGSSRIVWMIKRMITVLMCPTCLAARARGRGPYPDLTDDEMRAGLNLMPTWALEQKAAANRQVIAVMRGRLERGERVVPMYGPLGLAWLQRQAEIAEQLIHAREQSPPTPLANRRIRSNCDRLRLPGTWRLIQRLLLGTGPDRRRPGTRTPTCCLEGVPAVWRGVTSWVLAGQVGR